uniref:Ig-like domain-containing protein n=1 Tax=Oreochromis aureus TaxID=47969 RepID=A0A668SBL5_OREAU
MVTKIHFYSLFFLPWLLGLTVVVLQSEDQMSDPGRTVTLECKMGSEFSMSSYTMLWYRQNHHGAPVDYLLNEYDKTVGRLKSFLDASKNNFSLQITELHMNDSSTYYCAPVRNVIAESYIFYLK